MLNNMPKINMLSAAQIVHLRRMERKAVVSLGISNLIMVYAALSESFPEDSMTLLAGFASLREILETKHCWL